MILSYFFFILIPLAYQDDGDCSTFVHISNAGILWLASHSALFLCYSQSIHCLLPTYSDPFQPFFCALAQHDLSTHISELVKSQRLQFSPLPD